MQEFTGQVLALMRLVPEATVDALNESAMIVYDKARLSIQEHQSSGRVYKRDGRTYIASLPGYPPNSQHGAAGFVGTIQWEIDADALEAFVGTNDQRGPWFEFGTQTMEARPWLNPALESSADEISGIFSEVVGKALE